MSSVLRAYLFPLLLLAATFSDVNLIHQTYNQIPVRLSLGDLGIAVLIITALILWRREILERIQNNRAVFSVAGAFIAIALVSGLCSGEYWLASVKCCLRVYLLLLLLMVSAHETYLARGTLVCLFVYLIGINVLGVLEYFFPEHLHGLLLLFRNQESLEIFSHMRAGSVFPHPNHYGVFNALALVTLMSIQFGHRPFMNRSLALVASTALILGILFSGCRNAIMVVLVGTGLLSAHLVMRKQYRNAVRVLCVTSFFAFIVLGGSLLNIAGLGRVMNHIPALVALSHEVHLCQGTPPGMNNQNVLNKRNLIWQEGLHLFKDHPLLGIGANQFKYRNPMKTNDKQSTHMHSLYGELLVDQGIIGLVLVITLALFWFANVKTFWQAVIVVGFLLGHIFAYFAYFSLIGLVMLAWLVMITIRSPQELFHAQSHATGETRDIAVTEYTFLWPDRTDTRTRYPMPGRSKMAEKHPQA